MPPQPWERLKDETDPAWSAFKDYLELGPGRSLLKLAQAKGNATRTLRGRYAPPGHYGDWSKRFRWVERSKAWDARNDRIADEVVEKVVAAKARSNAEKALEREDRNFEFVDEFFLRMAKSAFGCLDNPGHTQVDAKQAAENFLRALAASSQWNIRWLPTPEAAQAVMTADPAPDPDDEELSDEVVKAMMESAAEAALKQAPKPKATRPSSNEGAGA